MSSSNGYKNLARNILPSGPEIVGGYGVSVYDRSGNRYFDLCSQTLNLNLGHRHPVIMEVLKELINNKDFIYFQSSMWRNSSMADLAEKLVEITPGDLTKVNLKLCNGGDANEDAFKRTRKFHMAEQRKRIVAQYRSHHGESSETLSASGKHFPKEAYLSGSGNFLHISPVYSFRRPFDVSEEDYAIECARSFESLVKNRGDIGGIVM